MKILSIDYGRKKVGLALALSKTAEPLRVIKYDLKSELIKKLDIVIQQDGVEEIVVGISGGEMGEEQRRFGKLLGEKFNLPVHFQDETLSTKSAQKLSIEAGIGRTKRKQKEDAYSAALILQEYLDEKGY